MFPVSAVDTPNIGEGLVGGRADARSTTLPPCQPSKIRFTPVMTDSSTIQVSHTPRRGCKGVPGLRRQGLQMSKTRAPAAGSWCCPFLLWWIAVPLMF